MTMSFDMGEVSEFAKAIEGKAAATPEQVEAVTHRGANNIKRRLREEMFASKHFKGAGPAIDYDLRSGGAFGGGFVEAEVGPERGKPGSLANIAYFGTSRGGGTVADPQEALDAEAPNFEKYIGDLAEDI